MQMETQSPVDGLLIVSEICYPGWKATLDGKPVTLLCADGILRAIPVPAGSHTVELRFAPNSFRLGMGLSVLALVGLVAIWGIAAIRQARL